MSKQSKFELCKAIYAEMVTTTEKLPAAERKRVVQAFVDRAGAKPGSANVYFTHILKASKELVAPVEASTTEEVEASEEVDTTSESENTPDNTEEVTENLSTMTDYYDYDRDDESSDSIIEEAFS